MDEENLIPYQAGELTGGRVLALAAHPDDEVLGAGGSLALSAETGAQIFVWIATDGSAQERQEGSSAAAESQEAYAGLRRDESRAAAQALGLPPPAFGGFPDRGLESCSRDLVAALESVIAEFEPDLVLCPSPVEIHPDHRALAQALYERVSASRPEDADHHLYRPLRVAFYEISHPILPNTLIDISGAGERKSLALQAFVTQQAVRDYAGAVAGLNAYRRLTLSGSGPVEAFHVAGYSDLSTRSFAEFQRSLGPTFISSGERATVPVSVVVRTRNRPALLAQALASLREQTSRPAQAVVVNDGGAPVGDILTPFRDAFDVVLLEAGESEGRSRAANRGVEAAGSDLVSFLDDDDLDYPDHLDRLVRGFRAGPEPVVYTDAATVVYGRKAGEWSVSLRTLQYSLDFDPDFLLLANYIPIHTLLLPRSLFRKVGGFDPQMDFSEDWDFLIRLSFQTAFRHLRAVTCEYRVFSETKADGFREPSGGPGFARARQSIYERYGDRRTPDGLARTVDRLRAQIAFWAERDGGSQGELRYQRESHRRLQRLLDRASSQAGDAQGRLAETELALRRMETERGRLLAENEIVHARLSDLFGASERYAEQASRLRAEIDRLNGLLAEIYVSRTWKLHLFLDRIRGRR